MALTSIDTALSTGAAAEPLSRDEALALFNLVTPEGIFRLGRAALKNRVRRFQNRATFVSNLQINPSM